MARPRKTLTPNDLKKVERLAARGLTMDQIARSIGWHPSTLYKNKARKGELNEAIKKGQAKGLQTISNELFELAKSGNLGAIIYYLKTRDPENWSESDKLRLETDPKNPPKFVVEFPE